MGFVMSAEEIAAAASVLKRVHYKVEALWLEFETDLEFVREMLPPRYQPDANRSALVTMGRFASKRSSFGATLVDLPARFEEHEGMYGLVHLVTGDMPVTIGREMWGEPKKSANIEFQHDDGTVSAHAERNGTRLVEVEAKVGDNLGQQTASGKRLELKGFLSATGSGLDHDPMAVIIKSDVELQTVREGSAELTLKGAPEDPLDTIPVRSIGKATYWVGDVFEGTETTYPLSPRDAYVPHIFGRAYDLAETGTETETGDFAGR